MQFLRNHPRLIAYILGLAVLVISFIGTYTHIISDTLVGLGVAVPFGVRLDVFGQNIISMAPLLLIILGLAFTLSMIAAVRITRFITILPILTHMLAGAAGVAAVLVLLQIWNGVNLIPASRETADFIFLTLCGALGGFIYRSYIAVAKN